MSITGNFNLANHCAVFFDELRPYINIEEQLNENKEKFILQSKNELLLFFENIKKILVFLQERGGFLNPWNVAGLKKDEVRTASALAGLWKGEFAGSLSRAFLASYLSEVIPAKELPCDFDWEQELSDGYTVMTEVNPLGEIADRIDLVVETASYFIGIEVKINTGLMDGQLERYSKSLRTRARRASKKAHLLFLAPYESGVEGVHDSSWGTIENAVREVTRNDDEDKNFDPSLVYLVKSFGSYVGQF